MRGSRRKAIIRVGLACLLALMAGCTSDWPTLPRPPSHVAVPELPPDLTGAEPTGRTAMPDGTLGAAFGPDGRLWHWTGVHAPEPSEDRVRADLVAAFDSPEPHLRNARVAAFGPGRWVWVAVGDGRLLLGYDGQRFAQREAGGGAQGGPAS